MQLQALPSLKDKARGRSLRSITFQDLSIFRGTPLARILRRHAAVLQNSEGSGATYDMSEGVDHIDTFISHNWSTPRGDKFLTLSLYFHLVPALITLAVAIPCCVGFTAAGRVPLLNVYELGERTQRGITCLVVGNVIFFVALFLWSDIMSALKVPTSIVFMDKTCIHQTDDMKKRKGIAGLGAFIRYSWSMVGVYTPLYLKKLWTVYEVAVFLAVHPMGRLRLRPVFEAQLTVGCTMVWSGLIVAEELLATRRVHEAVSPYLGSALSVPYLVTGILAIPGLYACCDLFRRWALEQAEMKATLRDFKIEETMCVAESDRELVYANIAAFMRDLGAVEPEKPQEAALEAFNQLVRSRLPPRLGYTFPYYCAFVMTLSSLLRGFDELGSDLYRDLPARELIPRFLWHAIFVVAVFPLGAAIGTGLCGRHPDLDGWWERGHVAACSLVVTAFVWGASAALGALSAAAASSEPALVGFACLSMALLTMVVVCFRPSWLHLLDRCSGERASEEAVGVADAGEASQTCLSSTYGKVWSVQTSASYGPESTVVDIDMEPSPSLISTAVADVADTAEGRTPQTESTQDSSGHRSGTSEASTGGATAGDDLAVVIGVDASMLTVESV